MKDNCPICEIPVCNKDDYFRPNGSTFECKNCGNFFLSRTTVQFIDNILDSKRKRAILSHAVWKMQNGDGYQPISDETINNILNNETLPNPAEQADNLLLWLGDKSDDPAKFQKIDVSYFSSKIGSFPYNDSVFYVIKRLWDKNYIEATTSVLKRKISNDPQKEYYRIRLTFDGWEKYEELKRGKTDSKRIFMAMDFDEKKYVRKVYEKFKEPASKTGFTLINRLLDKRRAGLIDDHIRVEIKQSKFLIADLTDDNRGSYWEAGFAEGLGKKVIYTCEKKFFEGQRTHFDTNHLTTIVWEEGELDEAAEQLKAVIRNTFPSEAKMED